MADDLVSAVESFCDVRREDIRSKAKERGLVTAREILILTGRRAGLNTKRLSEITGLSIAAISRRHDAALSRIKQDGELRRIADDVLERL